MYLGSEIPVFGNACIEILSVGISLSRRVIIVKIRKQVTQSAYLICQSPENVSQSEDLEKLLCWSDMSCNRLRPVLSSD